MLTSKGVCDVRDSWRLPRGRAEVRVDDFRKAATGARELRMDMARSVEERVREKWWRLATSSLKPLWCS